MPVALDKDVLLLAKPRTDSKIQLHNIQADYPASTFDIATAIPKDPDNYWSNYARGMAQVLANEVVAISRANTLRGFEALIGS